MSVIWKYKLGEGEDTFLNIPISHRTLCVQLQGEVPVIWVLVERVYFLSSVHFRTYLTGESVIGKRGIYIGTYQDPRYDMAFHVFEQQGEER